MSVYLGSTAIRNAGFGSDTTFALYIGATKVWPSGGTVYYQYMIPGGQYINTTSDNQAQVPGGSFVNGA